MIQLSRWPCDLSPGLHPRLVEILRGRVQVSRIVYISAGPRNTAVNGWRVERNIERNIKWRWMGEHQWWVNPRFKLEVCSRAQGLVEPHPEIWRSFTAKTSIVVKWLLVWARLQCWEHGRGAGCGIGFARWIQMRNRMEHWNIMEANTPPFDTCAKLVVAFPSSFSERPYCPCGTPP